MGEKDRRDGREKDKRIEWKREIETGMRMRETGVKDGEKERREERKLGRERKILRETGMGERGEATQRERERETRVGDKEWERQGRGRNPARAQSRVGAIPRGRNPVWAQSRVGAIWRGRNPVLTENFICSTIN